MKRLAKNKNGIALLKDAYASWQSGMDDLIPRGTKLDYSRRTGSNQSELNKILTRLELEE